MGSTRSSRGRRPDAGPPAVQVTPARGCDALVAWLLRVNRIYGPDEHLAAASRFVRVFNDAPGRAPVSESQISRWEHASSRIPYPVIRRYEQVLGLAGGRITAIADTLYRERLGRLGPPSLQRHAGAGAEEARETLGRLCERALGDEDMSGHDWDALSDLLWTVPVVLHPRRLWNQLAERMLAELLIAEGLAWLSRCEALNRLLGHRDGASPVIEACAGIIADHRSQVLIEPMALLELSPDPAAAGHLLRQIDGPASAHALRGAWWAVAEKTGRGHFTAGQVHGLARAASDTLQDNGSHPACRMGAAETLRQILPSLSPAQGRALRKLASRDPAAGHVLRSGTTSSMEATTAVAQRLSAATIMNMSREVLHRDPTLEQLVAEMLFHPQGTRRVVAAQTIAATPYRGPLAAVIGRELGRRDTFADVTVATAFVQALTHLGGPAEASLMQRLAITSGPPAAVSETAAWAAGHLPSGANFWAAAAARLLRPEAGLTACHAKGLVYSFGTAGRTRDLARLAAAPQLHTDLRAAATWWLTIPDHIARSARK
jgi:hypothetical protein